uniref:Uncharacterized protein n=1 Tax=Megaselia scalaris TaxID=36166 RepID=T1GL21_MEGSC
MKRCHSFTSLSCQPKTFFFRQPSSRREINESAVIYDFGYFTSLNLKFLVTILAFFLDEASPKAAENITDYQKFEKNIHTQIDYRNRHWLKPQTKEDNEMRQKEK